MKLPSRTEIYEEQDMNYFLFENDDKSRILSFNRMLYHEVCDCTHGEIVEVVLDGNKQNELLQYDVVHYFNDAYYICTKLSFDLYPESHFINEYYNAIEGNALDHWMVFSMVYWMLARNIALRPQHLNMMNTIYNFLFDDRDYFIMRFFIVFCDSIIRKHGISLKKEFINLELYPIKASFNQTSEIRQIPCVRPTLDKHSSSYRLYNNWIGTLRSHVLKFLAKTSCTIIQEGLLEDKSKEQKTEKKEKGQNVFKPIGQTFQKTTKVTDLQLTLIMQRLTAAKRLDPNCSADDWLKLFSGVDSMFTIKWLGKPGELRDLFYMLTTPKNRVETGYIIPQYNYQRIVLSHFTDEKGNRFSRLRGQKSINTFLPILADCEFTLQCLTERMTTIMKNLIIDNEKALSEFGIYYNTTATKQDDGQRIINKK